MAPARSFASAAWAVALADVSMSLDNVLAVAGAAREHPGILVIGLVLSVALMGIAANVLARYIERYRWIAYVGLAVIVYVAGKMIWEGTARGDAAVLLRPARLHGIRIVDPSSRRASSARCASAASARAKRRPMSTGTVPDAMHPNRLPRRPREILAGVAI